MRQVELGLSQISSVVQNNTATAEENSATSQEMSAQAAALRHEVGRFRPLLIYFSLIKIFSISEI